jgi:hypothetical protein
MNMGELAKTIHIEVPSNIVYTAIKEAILSNALENYCKDLLQDFITEYILARDVPNSELMVIGEKLLSKAEIKYVLRPIGNFTEITIYLKYRLIPELSAKQAMLSIISSLLMLEKGYKAGLEAAQQKF